MSSSSSDGLDERVEEIFDEICEETFNSILAAESDHQRSRAYIERDREGRDDRLWNDYFSENATYSSQFFRRRFRMNRNLFLRLVHDLRQSFPFFQQRKDATGRLGLSSLQKCTAAIRMLAYGSAADTVDEYLRLAETTALSCLHNFTDGIIQLYEEEYLRRPTAEDLQRLLDIGETRGFPRMIGSIDCMHWEWKNCPTALKGQYARGSGPPTIVLEAVVSQDLWIWHTFFGPPGTLNDINVLDRSPVFDDILEGRAPRVKYVVNGRTYRLAYYLTYGIYPKWSTFIQSITLPQTPEQELFAKRQEAARKDVERAFGVLQAQFAIVRNPVKTLDKGKIGKIMRACIILHNMIVKNERNGYATVDISDFEEGDIIRNSEVDTERPTNLNNLFAVRNDVRDRNIHEHLKNDLIDHLWNKFGEED
ncbi:hypothetical protein Bca101_060378 [Brassica carinata]